MCCSTFTGISPKKKKNLLYFLLTSSLLVCWPKVILCGTQKDIILHIKDLNTLFNHKCVRLYDCFITTSAPSSWRGLESPLGLYQCDVGESNDYLQHFYDSFLLITTIPRIPLWQTHGTRHFTAINETLRNAVWKFIVFINEEDDVRYSQYSGLRGFSAKPENQGKSFFDSAFRTTDRLFTAHYPLFQTCLFLFFNT